MTGVGPSFQQQVCHSSSPTHKLCWFSTIKHTTSVVVVQQQQVMLLLCSRSVPQGREFEYSILLLRVEYFPSGEICVYNTAATEATIRPRRFSSTLENSWLVSVSVYAVISAQHVGLFSVVWEWLCHLALFSMNLLHHVQTYKQHVAVTSSLSSRRDLSSLLCYFGTLLWDKSR